MPHTNSSLKIYSFAKEHKKRFNFVLGSASPFPDREDGGDCDLSETSQPPGTAIELCKDLTQVPVSPGGAIDVFRVGFNAIWVGGGSARRFGIPEQNCLKYDFSSLGSPVLDYKGGMKGYGLAIEPDAEYVLPGDRRNSLSEIFVSDHRPSPLGEPQRLADALKSPSITEFRKTKQEFRITPALGGRQSLQNRTALETTNPKGMPSWWWDNNAWQGFVNENILGTFEDLSFEMWWPFSKEEIQSVSPIKNIYVDIKPSYNFYVPGYEEVVKTTPATLLPNVYVFASEKDESFVDADNSRFKQHIDLKGKISNTFIDVLNEKGEKIGEKDNGQYFEKWARAMQKYQGGTDVDLTLLARKYKNLVFPMSNLNLIKDNQGKEKLFPMHIKIDFSTDTNTRFADVIHNAKLGASLIERMISTQDTWETKQGEYNFKGWERAPLNYGKGYENTRTFDLAAWIDSIITGTSVQPFENLLKKGGGFNFDGVFLGPFEDEVRAASDPKFRFFITLMMAVFKNDASKIVDEKFRSFKDLLRGPDHDGPKLAYSETVVYRIERRTTTKENPSESDWESDGEPNVWFPNSSEIDVLSYVDTQVKYNTSYRYIIWAYQLVVGNKYQYALKEIADQEDEFWANLCLFNEPSIKLIEVPFYDSILDHPSGIKIVDSPPVTPDVNIVPYAGADDKILIWLNSNAGDYLLPDIRILPSDDLDRNSIKHSDEDGRELLGFSELGFYLPWTRDNISDSLIRFKSDDYVNEFEIFRLSERPKKFSDFAAMGEPWKVMAPDSTSAAFVDETIRPNRKYYYIFRAKDNHGHISNPTAVYEVELVKDNENVYSLINTIDMGLTPDRQITKSGRKIIQIKPSFLQSMLDEDYLSRINNEADVNSENVFEKNPPVKSVWGSGNDDAKKFKIRIISKKTGKKFDLNVKFKIQKDSGTSQ